MTRLTKSFTTFETEVELRGVRYTLFAEIDITEHPHSHYCGFRGMQGGSLFDIEITDWSATDAGCHEIINPDLKRELRAELGLQLIAKRERILERA